MTSPAEFASGCSLTGGQAGRLDPLGNAAVPVPPNVGSRQVVTLAVNAEAPSTVGTAVPRQGTNRAQLPGITSNYC